MKTVRLRYKVRLDFIERNKQNIEAVLNDLQKHPILGMRYAIYYLGKGEFMHINQSQTTKGTSILGQRDAFKQFRKELQSAHLLGSPKIEEIELIGTNKNLI